MAFSRQRIGVDLLGSDNSPEQLTRGVLSAAEQLPPGSELVVFVPSEQRGSLPSSVGEVILRSIPASEEITMEDHPLQAVRQKQLSSMMMAIRLLRDGQIDALVCPGNTGALVAGCALFLPKLPHIIRPALLALLPSRVGQISVIDVGGNLSTKTHHLVQFAKLGTAHYRAANPGKIPTVGLLNIGQESLKGTAEHRSAFEALTQAASSSTEKWEFLGNIEGRQVFEGAVDVLVTDGFTGNVFLKTSEGVSAFVLNALHESFSGTTPPRVLQVLSSLARRIDYDEHPGALVCGVEHVVIKCHGASSPQAIELGILRAASLLETQWIARMQKELT